MKVKRLTLTILAIGGVSGCSVKAYDGPRLPSDQTARIRTSMFGAVKLVEVDGRRVGWRGSECVVLPGVHNIRCQIKYARRWEEFRIRHIAFHAKASHVYLVDGQRNCVDDGLPWLWIVDSETNSVVAGEKPPGTK